MSLLIAFYGDDFTGSTDALEFLSRAGVRTVLFIEAPTPEQLEKYQGLQAIGVAGMTRAMTPDAMENALVPAFSALKDLKSRHVHYKVCSTFDSSPDIGSIGKAIDVGTEIFGSEIIPLLVAAPHLGRHCVFGNLFAKMGIGSDGKIFRLDRHPSMSVHPTTPADESDLRLHLEKQTSKKVGLIDILQIEQEETQSQASIQNQLAEGKAIMLFDALYQEQMLKVGKLIEAYAEDEKTLFSVGSSGVEVCLGEVWAREGLISPASFEPLAKSEQPVLVVSGSCSPVTAGQISFALENGFKDLALDVDSLLADDPSPVIEKYASEAVAIISEGFDVIIHTSIGEQDPRLKRSSELFSAKGIEKSQTASIYGTILGKLARAVAERTNVHRIVIAGGDSSSYAARAMGVEAVEMIAPLGPGAPLCRAYAPDSPVDGKELNFKGGQVGKPDYFVMAKGKEN